MTSKLATFDSEQRQTLLQCGRVYSVQWH